jgi:hypothetical protein
LIPRLYIIGFLKARIFNITVAILVVFKKNNIIAIGSFITNAGNYFYTYMVYTKSKFDLFYTFASILRGYDKKKERLQDFNNVSYLIF